MEDDFEKKVEIIKQRTNLSDEEARALLIKYNGDVIEALIQNERQKLKYIGSKDTGDNIDQKEFIEYIKELIKSGNVSRIIIRKDEEVLVNIPVNAGIVVGLLLLLQPVLIVIGATAAVMTKLEIDIIKKDGTVEVVNKVIKSAVDNSAKTATEMGQCVKDKFTVEYGKIKKKISHIKKNKF